MRRVEPDAQSIVTRLRRRDASAFDEVYTLYHERIFRFLLRLSGSHHTAEDLFQDTWILVARDAPSLAENSDLTAWLFTVAKNRYRSHRRWAMLDLKRIFSLTRLSGDTIPSPEGQIEARSDAALAKQAFEKLSPAFKEILLLSVGEGLDAPTVAAVLGIRPDTARQRLSRARAELLAAIQSDGPRKNS